MFMAIVGKRYYSLFMARAITFCAMAKPLRTCHSYAADYVVNLAARKPVGAGRLP